jgi:pimeloyl-ACP methyl ester carboxylesterase
VRGGRDGATATGRGLKLATLPSSGSAWPAAVIRCRRAKNPPESHQRRTAERLKASYAELDTGHYPMLSQPAELVDLLVRER